MKVRRKPLARKADRDYARRLVELYRSKEPVAIGVPGLKGELGVVDGDHLAMELEAFAENGTFDLDGALPLVRDIAIAAIFAQLRVGHSLSYEESVEQCAEWFRCSETTVRAAVKKHTAK